MGGPAPGRAARTEPRTDRTAPVVVLGVIAGVPTTPSLLFDPGLPAAVEFLATLAAVHVSLPLATNSAYWPALATAYVFVGGWLGRIGATMAVSPVVLGVSNAASVVRGGPSLFTVLFGASLSAVLSYGLPPVGVVVRTLAPGPNAVAVPAPGVLMRGL